MTFSVIIPCFNSGKYLEEAIDSVALTFENYSSDYEIIIVNDGSDDISTLALLKKLSTQGQVKIFHQENRGPGAARNTGVLNSTGEYLIFLDSDNKLKPHFVEKTFAQLKLNEAGVIYGACDFFGDTTAARFETGPYDINKLIIQNYIDICILTKRELFDEMGGFDESPFVIGFEDWIFHLQAWLKGVNYHFITEPIYDYRVLKYSLSQRHTQEYWDKVIAYTQDVYISKINNRLPQPDPIKPWYKRFVDRLSKTTTIINKVTIWLQ